MGTSCSEQSLVLPPITQKLSSEAPLHTLVETVDAAYCRPGYVWFTELLFTLSHVGLLRFTAACCRSSSGDMSSSSVSLVSVPCESVLPPENTMALCVGRKPATAPQRDLGWNVEAEWWCESLAFAGAALAFADAVAGATALSSSAAQAAKVRREGFVMPIAIAS